MHIIPLSQIPAQSFNIVLEGQHCTIALYWRQERLCLDLSVGNPKRVTGTKNAATNAKKAATSSKIAAQDLRSIICTGAICQNRADIVQSKSPDFNGTLHFYDMEGDRPPHWEGLHNGTSGRWKLLYIPEGERLPKILRH